MLIRYRIYSINRPGRILNFWTLRVGAHSRLGAYQIFTIFSKCSSIFFNKTVNANNKKRRCNKARFLYNILKKTPSSGGSLITSYWSFRGREWGGVGAYIFEVGANSRLGAYSNKYGIPLCSFEF